MYHIGVWFVLLLGVCTAQFKTCPSESARRVQNAFGQPRNVQRGVLHLLPCPEFRPNEPVDGVFWFKGRSIDDPSRIRLVSLYSGKVIPGVDRFDITPDFGLVIQGVESTDGGRYLCDVVPVSTGNRVGKVDITVIEESFPAGKSEASSTASFHPGRRQTLPCECASQTSDVVYWSTGDGVTTDTQIIGARFSDDATLQIQNGADYSIDSDDSLTVNSLIDVRDTQRFWCHVFQSDGTLRNCDTNVQIADASNPTGVMQASATSFYLEEGLRQVLPCISWIPGTPTCAIQWLKLDTTNQPVLNYNLSTNQVESPSPGYDLASDFDLNVASAEEDHAGRYRCGPVDTATENSEIHVRIIGDKFPLDGGSATAGDTMTYEPDRKLSLTCHAILNISLTTKATLFWSFGALNAQTTTLIGKLNRPDGSKTMSDLEDDCFQISFEGFLNLNNCSQDDDVRYWCHVFPYGSNVIRSYVDSRLQVPVHTSGPPYIVPVVVCVCVLVIVLLIVMLLIWRSKRNTNYERVPTKKPMPPLEVTRITGKIKTFVTNTFARIPITPWVAGPDAETAEMDQVYVPAEMFLNVPIQEGFVKYKLNSQSEIFDDGIQELKSRHVIVNGRSGSGKSTFLYKVACDWSMGRAGALLAEKKLVFPIQAGDFIQPGDLGQVVVEHMLPSQPSTMASSINEYCRSHPSDVALLIDGCNDKRDIDTVMGMMKNQGLLECSMIMTTRNAKIARDACKQHNMRHITINGFSPDTAREYIKDILKKLIDHTPGDKSPEKRGKSVKSSKPTDTVVTIETTPLIMSSKETQSLTSDSPQQPTYSDSEQTQDEKPQVEDTSTAEKTQHTDTIINMDDTPLGNMPEDASRQDKSSACGSHPSSVPLKDSTEKGTLNQTDKKTTNSDAQSTAITTHQKTKDVDTRPPTALPTASQPKQDGQNTDAFSDLRMCLDRDVLPPQFVCLPANLATLCWLSVWTKGEAFCADSLTIGDVCYRLIRCMFEKIEVKTDCEFLSEEPFFVCGTRREDMLTKEQLGVLMTLGKVALPKISKYYEGCLDISESNFPGVEGGQETLEVAIRLGLLCHDRDLNRKPVVKCSELNADVSDNKKAWKPNNRFSFRCCRRGAQSESDIPLLPTKNDVQMQRFVLEILEQLCVAMYLAHSEESVSNWLENISRKIGLGTSLGKISNVVTFACRESVTDREAVFQYLAKIVKTSWSQSKSLKDVLPVQKALELGLEINRDSHLFGSANKTFNTFFEKGRIRMIGISSHKIRLLVYLLKYSQDCGGGTLHVKSIELFRIGRNDWKDVQEMLVSFVQEPTDVGKKKTQMGGRQVKQESPQSPTPSAPPDTHKQSATLKQEEGDDLESQQEGHDVVSITSDETGQDDNKGIKPNEAVGQMSSDASMANDSQEEHGEADAMVFTNSKGQDNDLESNLPSDKSKSKRGGGKKSSPKKQPKIKKKHEDNKAKPRTGAAPNADDHTKHEAENCQKDVPPESDTKVHHPESKEPTEDVPSQPQDVENIHRSLSSKSAENLQQGEAVQDNLTPTTPQGEGNTVEGRQQAEEAESQADEAQTGDRDYSKKQKLPLKSQTMETKTKKVKARSDEPPPADDKSQHFSEDFDQVEEQNLITKHPGTVEQPEEEQTPEQENEDVGPSATIPEMVFKTNPTSQGNEAFNVSASTKLGTEFHQPDSSEPKDNAPSQIPEGKKIHRSLNSKSAEDPQQGETGQDVLTLVNPEGEGNTVEGRQQADEPESEKEKAQIAGKVSSKKQKQSKKDEHAKTANAQSVKLPPVHENSQHQQENIDQSGETVPITKESASAELQVKEETLEQKNETVGPSATDPEVAFKTPSSAKPKLGMGRRDNTDIKDYVGYHKSSREEMSLSPRSHSPEVPLEAPCREYDTGTLRLLRQKVALNREMPVFPDDEPDISVLHTVQSLGLQEIIKSQCGECHSSLTSKEFVDCLPKLNMLESLILVGTILSPDDICLLTCHLSNLQKLKTLDLRLNQLFDDRAFKAVAASLCIHEELTDLRLSLYKVTQDGYRNVVTMMEISTEKLWKRLNTLYLLHASPAEPLVEFFSNILKYLHSIERIHVSASSPDDDISEGVLRGVKQNMENPDFVPNLQRPVIQNMERLRSVLAPIKLPKEKKKQTTDSTQKLEGLFDDILRKADIKVSGKGAVIGAKVGRKVAGKTGERVGLVVGAAAGAATKAVL